MVEADATLPDPTAVMAALNRAAHLVLDPAPLPEPGTALLALAGMSVLASRRRKTRRQTETR